ncbi:MAG: serine/threonine protein kinase [Mariniblastus sp.]|nr:serine/threonine protein kinase [Mariniblastus sp.]
MNSEQNQPELQAQDLTGKTIGDYRVIRRLGRGGMAEVYLAEQVSLRRNVALKVLHANLAGDPSYIERFRREAQSAAALVQANIVQIYEVGEVDGYHFIAQEYVAGRNLRQYLGRYGAVESVMAVNVIRQVAMALQKAGEMNVIHRDIKPENIMLSTKGEVKVADFGLARINDDSIQQGLTQIGMTMGTPMYMSPEQVEGKQVDPRSDIYSLGVTAYHMLAGEPPYDGDNALAIALKHIKNQPQPLQDIRPDIPPELVHVVNGMMSKNPDDRPASGAVLLKELRKVKIDLDEGWDRLIEQLAISETGVAGPTLAESKLAVTRQLQAVMKGHSSSWWTRPITMVTFLVLMIIGGFAGSWLANQDVTRDPLQVAIDNMPEIPRRNTVKDQYRFAHARPSIENFQSVLDYFPLETAPEGQVNTTKLYRDWALERIGEIHIQSDDWERAYPIYLQFAEFDESERLNTVGHAGLAIIFENQLETRKVKIELDAIEDGKVELLNEIFRDRIIQMKKEYGASQVLVVSFDRK